MLANNSKNFPLQKDDPNNPFDVFDSYGDKGVSIKELLSMVLCDSVGICCDGVIILGLRMKEAKRK